MSVAVVVLTYNRVHLLRQCVENVLSRVSDLTREVVIWDNGSTDGTRAYLESLADPRLRVVLHERNIGPNAYDVAIRGTSSEYVVELDDDVIDAPDEWDRLLLTSLERLPAEYALLSANLVDNPLDSTARIMYGKDAHLYRSVEVNGVGLKVGGPIGGGCAIISRATYDRLGGFGQQRRRYWSSDAVLMRKIRTAGMQGAYLRDLEVLHAGGAHYSAIPDEKLALYRAERRRRTWRNAVKRLLLCVPRVRRLNERHGWFHPPES